MKTNYLLFISILVLLIIVSCNTHSEDPLLLEKQSKNVSLKITGNLITGGLPTRSEATPVTGATTIKFGTGHLLFVASNGTITKHIPINNSPTSDGSNINITDVTTTGVMVSNVPASSVYVIAVSNLPTEVESRFPSSPENANITSVQNLALNVNQLSDGTGGVAAIPLYGIGNITNSSEEMGYWETHVDLRPVGLRLEIKQFTAENDIKEYQVDGIFISSFYQFMSISGTHSSLIHKGEENDNHTKYKGGSAEYPDELPLWDYNSSGLGVFNNTTLEYASANIGNVWAYNLFPGVGTNTTNKDVPHIIIRLSNIQYADGTTATGPKYLTVKGYNGNKLFSFVKGNVYSISNLQFNSTNLTDKPTVPDPGTDPGINPGTDPKEVDVDITVRGRC